MCGIFGYFSRSTLSDNKKNLLKKTSNYLLERGPDYLGSIKKSNYFLANSRLKIVSKKDIDIPIYKHECYISFSGEILNFEQLKKKLKQIGYNFFSDTDTEVILSLYDCYGLDFVKYLRGFFSIAIYDIKKKKLILAVDRIGNKSIFYNYNNKNLLFSSQQSYLIRSNLLKFEINKKRIDEYLVFGDISGNQTLHSNIKKMLPGEMIIYDFINLKKFNYYDIKQEILKKRLEKQMNYKESFLNLDKHFCDTVELYSNNSAYDKSILLSGGVDSGLVAIDLKKFSNKLTGYTAHTSDLNSQNFNEYDQIKPLVKKYNIKSDLVSFESKNLIDNLKKIYSTFEEPLPSSSLLLYRLSEYINKNSKNRICFTGDGSDEIFGGYERHRAVRDTFNKKGNIDDIILGFNYLTVNRLKRFFKRNFIIPETRINFFKDIVNEKNFSSLDKTLLYDLKFYLPIFLRSVEIIGMQNSIEYRSPFTDHIFIENVFNLRDKYRMNKSANKLILKRMFKNRLNSVIKKKKLFSTPFLTTQFRSGELKEILLSYNNNSKINDYFPVKYIKSLLEDNLNQDHSNTLMRILTLNYFLESAK